MARLHPEGLRGLLSRRSARARALGVDPGALGEAELLELLAREPGLLRRPLLTDGRRLVVGYDPDELGAAFAEDSATEP
jgi:arsenate reductase-like glutaredoxin family protein